jgi:aspartyl protease family protein
MKYIYSFIISIIVISGCIYLLMQINHNIEINKDNMMHILYFVLLMLFMFVNLFMQSKREIFTGLRQLFVWMSLIFVLIGLYGLRYQIQDFFHVAMLNLMPSHPAIARDGKVQIAKSANGHYMLNAKVNGKLVYFLVDTGATDVSLTLEDALKVGVQVDGLIFNKPISTANGINYAALIFLESMIVGDIEIHNVRASVTKNGLDVSLLGMSFLSRLSSYSFSNDILSMEK